MPSFFFSVFLTHSIMFHYSAARRHACQGLWCYPDSRAHTTWISLMLPKTSSFLMFQSFLFPSCLYSPLLIPDHYLSSLSQNLMYYWTHNVWLYNPLPHLLLSTSTSDQWGPWDHVFHFNRSFWNVEKCVQRQIRLLLLSSER